MNAITGTVCLALVLATVVTPALAQEDEEFNLRDALMEHFRNRLRVELSLTDAQAEALFPLLETQETERQRVNRERGQIHRQLQKGFQGGASDSELRELLERSTRLEQSWFRMQSELQSKIDRELTVRQQVKLRFFVRAFREEVQRRMRNAREERMQRRRFGESGN